MIGIFSTKRYVLKALIITFLISLSISATPSPQFGPVEGRMRDDMLLIAERYATHQWNAIEDNAWSRDRIETPDRANCLAHNWYTEGCWEIGVNFGVPYRWGGATPIHDPDLGLYRFTEGGENEGGYFRDKVAAGKAAGDISLDMVNGKQKLASVANTAGVDCVGLIDNTWRLNVRAGTSAVSGQTRAIRFEMLKPGDILMKFGTGDNTGNHVMLFKEFCYDPELCPDSNPPMIKVYEAQLSYRKVTESVWKIIDMEDYVDDPYGDKYGPSQTHKLEMQRVKVKLGDNWVQARDLSENGYIPRTFFKPRDIVLVLDRSGSMGAENRIEQMKQAAEMFVNQMRPGDRIGVIAFSHEVEQIFPPLDEPLTEENSEIDSGYLAYGARARAVDAISTLFPDGGTSIGGGLRLAQDLLNRSGNDGNRIQRIVLLSDGEENSAPMWSELKADHEITVPVNTVGMVYNSAVLIDIADSTGGGWYGTSPDAWISYIFQNIVVDTYQEDIVKAAKTHYSSSRVPLAQVSLQTNAEEKVVIDSTVGSVTFSFTWPLGNPDLTLVQPDNTVVDPAVADADPNIEFVSGAAYAFYKISGPQKGEWTVRISGQSASEYSLVTSVAGALLVSVDTDENEYFKGETIKITAAIEDSILDSPIEPEYIYGAVIQVIAQKPDGAVASFELLDDGAHGDGEADDGVYANTFSDTDIAGSYDFHLGISGNTNRDGMPFSREKSLSVFVVDTLFNPTPVLHAGDDQVIDLVNSMTLDASYFVMHRPENYTARVDWGDGTNEALPVTLADPYTGKMTGTHAYSAAGNYTVEVCITDPHGTVWCDTANVKVVPPSDVVAVESGSGHTCSLASTGEMYCWGSNSHGQIGDGTNSSRPTPVSVSGLSSGVVAMTAGEAHTCALTSTGGVKCWGNNYKGQLGDGTTTNRNTPVDVSGLTSGVIAITAGGSHTCALTDGGAVKCWGENYDGQLGNGMYSENATPLPVNVIGLTTGVTNISAGYAHTCAITASGAAKCWGDNGTGQLGVETARSPRNTPVTVSGLATGAVKISAGGASGGSHTCVITTSGGVKCWGTSSQGELGNGTTGGFSSTPVNASGITGAIEISTGYGRTCALIAGGGAKCWGAGQKTPVDVAGVPGVIVSISVGESHACAVTASGYVKCWGSNNSLPLGIGTTSYSRVPVNTRGLHKDVIAIESGSSHTCILTRAGGVRCWGSNTSGALGGTSTAPYTPVDVTGLASGVTAISAGGDLIPAHTCVVTTGGGVKCWGFNLNGQLGDNRAGGPWSDIPVDVSGLSSGVVAVTAGGRHTCALTVTGEIKCWGENSKGQIGDGSTTRRYTPVDVNGLTTGGVAISAGEAHTCALTAGSVKCWGDNSYGQLGNGTTTRSLVPVEVGGLNGEVLEISAGGVHTCALMADGGVKCWGMGELVPVDVNGLDSDVAEISAGRAHTCALTTSGGLKCWGSNLDGQLGVGSNMPSGLWDATDVVGLTSGVAAVTAGGDSLDAHTCALLSNGDVQCWGSNDSGQLGHGFGSGNSILMSVIFNP